jgi:hypothetical protein
VRPAAREFSFADTHRLIPSKWSEEGTVLSRAAGRDEDLDLLVELDGATNERLLGQQGLVHGVSVFELLYDVPYARIVNAAFLHPAPMGARFSNGERGAWYAGVERTTAMAEVAAHKLRQLEDVNWPEEEAAAYDDYLADFEAEFHDLTARGKFKEYLTAEPVPECYAAPQALALELMREGANGVVYPSVRAKGGKCVACFRPALVYHVRRGVRMEFRMKAGRAFKASDVVEVESPE